MLFVALISCAHQSNCFSVLIGYRILLLTSMDEIHGIVELKLEKVTVKLGYMGKSAQL